MAKKYNASMFDKIKDALKKTERVTSGSFANIMKFPAGHTYTLRLIPDVEGIEAGDDKTFFHHYINSWTSKKDGSYVSAISLKSFGERDPINEARWKLYKEWKDSEPAKDEKFENPIKERESWFVNVLVVEDPANPENNGKVKILNMGPQLKAIVDDAMTGDRSDEFGAAIFDLSKDGADFKIKAEEQGIYTTYIKSFFTSKTTLDLSDEEIDGVYENVHDLTQVYQVKSVEDLQSLLDDHFYCEEETATKVEKKPLQKKEVTKKETPKKKVVVDEDPTDDIPMFHESDKKTSDPDVDDLLAELDID
jgi:hypothetical protein